MTTPGRRWGRHLAAGSRRKGPGTDAFEALGKLVELVGEQVPVGVRRDARGGCGTTEPGRKGWQIDHCHTTGLVWCLLCNRCNTVLGLCDEDPAILGRLAKLAAEFNQLRLAT